MKTTIYHIPTTTLIVSTIVALSSCDYKEDRMGPDKTFTKNFVQVYVIPGEMGLSMSQDKRSQSLISVVFRGENIYNMGDAYKEKYEVYSQKYEDASYNREIFPFTNQAMGEDIQTIDVRCDKDVSATHPAGSSLSDVLKLYSISPYKFIRNNYKPLKDYEYPEGIEDFPFREGGEYYPVYKLLSDITPSDLTLLIQGFYLQLTVPLAAGEYNFTITVKFSEEKILTGTVLYVVE